MLSTKLLHTQPHFAGPFNGNMPTHGHAPASLPAHPIPIMPFQDSMDGIEQQMNNMYLAPGTIKHGGVTARATGSLRHPAEKKAKAEKKNVSKKRAGSSSSTSSASSKVEHGGVKKVKGTKKAAVANEQRKRQSALNQEFSRLPPPQQVRKLPETPRLIPVASQPPPKKPAARIGSRDKGVPTKVEHGGIKKNRKPNKAARATDTKHHTRSSGAIIEKPLTASQLTARAKKDRKQLIDQLEKTVLDGIGTGAVTATAASLLASPRTVRVQPQRAAKMATMWRKRAKLWGTIRENQRREERRFSGPARVWVDAELDAYVAFNFKAEARIRRVEDLDFD